MSVGRPRKKDTGACVMAPLDAGSDEEEEPAPGTSDRDYGEHQGDMEGSVAELDGRGRWEQRRNLRE